MKNRIIRYTISLAALGLLSGPASADVANQAIIDQHVEDGQVTVRQVGDANRASAIQRGKHDMTIFIRSEGQGNLAEVNQDGRYNNTNVQQVGEQNEATVLQQETRASRIQIRQGIDGPTGLRNVATARFQKGEHHDMRLLQSGESNRVTAEQDGHRGTLITNQTGSSNLLDAKQGNPWSQDLYLWAKQDGIGNEMQVDQLGYRNRISAQQIGSDNTAQYNQNGAENNINGQQLGSNNDASVRQLGENASVLVIQDSR